MAAIQRVSLLLLAMMACALAPTALARPLLAVHAGAKDVKKPSKKASPSPVPLPSPSTMPQISAADVLHDAAVAVTSCPRGATVKDGTSSVSLQINAIGSGYTNGTTLQVDFPAALAYKSLECTGAPAGPCLVDPADASSGTVACLIGDLVLPDSVTCTFTFIQVGVLQPQDQVLAAIAMADPTLDDSSNNADVCVLA